jgi:O-antigen ligase
MKGIRTGLMLLIAFAVLAHGVVEVWSQSILEIGAAALLVAWAILLVRNPDWKVHGSPLLWPLLAFLGIGLMQLLFRATAYPFLTRVDLLQVAACFAAFFLFLQVFRDRPALTTLAWFLVLLCFGVSLLGIIQHFTAEGKIFWFRTVGANSDPFGPFVDRNHFAGFVELTLPVGFALLVFRGIRRDVFALVSLLAIVPVSAMILSGSRAGVICLAFEVGVLTLLVRLRRSQERPRMLAIGIVSLLAVVLIAWVGAGKAIARFRALHSNEVTTSRRLSMARGAARIFLGHPLKGCGLGALVAVYPRYETAYDGKLVDHVHNDYIENLAETGILGGLCGLAFFFFLFRDANRCFVAEQGHFSRAIHAAGIVALSGLLLHSFVDFNLHIPSNVLLFLLQAHLATCVPLPSEAPAIRPRSRSRRYAEVAQ